MGDIVTEQSESREQPEILTTHTFAPVLTGKSRRVSKLITAPSAFEGEGFPVRRAFAGLSRSDVDPFVILDQMGEVDYAPGEPKGTPWHPHRGMETFTYLLKGEFIHQDSHGGGGIIREGGTQYMTAGDGILHIETPPPALVESGGLFHGLQLWINLPRVKKRIAPQYQDLQGRDVAHISSHDGGAVVRVLAGTLAGHAGPGISHTPIAITHISVSPGAAIDIPWPHEFNALVHALAGQGTVSNDVAISTGQTAVLVDGDFIRISASEVQESRTSMFEAFLIGGVPLNEPVVQYGPFVMNSMDEIQEAFEDFQAGRLGRVPADAVQPHRG